MGRQKGRQDLGNVGMVKDENGNTLVDEESIKKRWSDYFRRLLNEENERKELEGVEKVVEPFQEIQRGEFLVALGKMKNIKAEGPFEVSSDLVKL